MKRILLNIDLGESGSDLTNDLLLLRHGDIVNIACGGHAGNATTVSTLRESAERDGISVTAHLSYPDKTNFGRKSVSLPFDQLRESLDNQLALMPGITAVKLHGALYNDSCTNDSLAGQLGQWFADVGISSVITLSNSALARCCQDLGIQLLAEAFAERRYKFSTSTSCLSLVNRTHPDACITEYDKALAQARSIISNGKIEALIDQAGIESDKRVFDITVDTICIHSDSPIARELASGVAELLRTENDSGKE